MLTMIAMLTRLSVSDLLRGTAIEQTIEATTRPTSSCISDAGVRRGVSRIGRLVQVGADRSDRLVSRLFNLPSDP